MEHSPSADLSSCKGSDCEVMECKASRQLFGRRLKCEQHRDCTRDQRQRACEWQLLLKPKAMKKIKLDAGKLQLHKEKIASLTSIDMSQVNGGATGGGGPAGGGTELAGTRILCFMSNAGNCSDGSCAHSQMCGDCSSVVIVCIPVRRATFH